MDGPRRPVRSPDGRDRADFLPLPDAEYLRHRSLVERQGRGLGLRVDVPLETHAEWHPSAGRADPVAILERQSAQRIPELVPIRYGRMSASAFAFY